MKHKSKQHNDSAPRKKGGVGIAAACLKAQPAVFSSGFLLLLLFSAVACSMEDPDSVLRPLSLCALFLSALVGGFAAARMSSDGVLAGALSGAVTVCLIFLLSLLPLQGPFGTFSARVMPMLCLIGSSAAGGLLGKGRKQNRGKHRKPPSPRKHHGS